MEGRKKMKAEKKDKTDGRKEGGTAGKPGQKGLN